MLASWIRRALAVAFVAAPISAFAADSDAPAPRPVVQTVTVNAGQGGFVTIALPQYQSRTYALTGNNSARAEYYRFGQGSTWIQYTR